MTKEEQAEDFKKLDALINQLTIKRDGCYHWHGQTLHDAGVHTSISPEEQLEQITTRAVLSAFILACKALKEAMREVP